LGQNREGVIIDSAAAAAAAAALMAIKAAALAHFCNIVLNYAKLAIQLILQSAAASGRGLFGAPFCRSGNEKARWVSVH
jgi:hypothetical protein